MIKREVDVSHGFETFGFKVSPEQEKFLSYMRQEFLPLCITIPDSNGGDISHSSAELVAMLGTILDDKLYYDFQFDKISSLRDYYIKECEGSVNPLSFYTKVSGISISHIGDILQSAFSKQWPFISDFDFYVSDISNDRKDPLMYVARAYIELTS